METPAEYLSTREAADLLGLSKARIDQFCRDGRLPSVTVGNARIILRADVVAFRKQKRPAGAKPGKRKPRADDGKEKAEG